MSLCVVSYPIVSADDYAKIQEFRRRNDELYYHLIEPHFALVFPTEGWDVGPFVAEVEKQLQGCRPVSFCIRCATLDKDAFIPYYHAFLVPDEGHGQIVKLHYRLSADKFFPHRSLDVDFIPHIGIGNSRDPLRCVEMVEGWNREEFAIPGQITEVDIASYDNDAVRTIRRVPLGR